MNTKTIPKNKLGFVVHESENVPKYFEINKSLLRFFILFLPILSIISLAIIITGVVYFKSINDILQRQESGNVQELKIKNTTLTKEISFIEEQNHELEQKLANKTIKTLEVLNLIKFTAGQMNKSRFSNIEMQSKQNNQIFTPIFDSKKVHLKFHLLNKSPTNKRQSGFLFIVMKSSNVIQIYPQNSFSNDSIQIVFNRGEVFGFNRLRYVHASFDLPTQKNNLIFKILLFNKLGDLIYQNSIFYENFERTKK